MRTLTETHSNHDHLHLSECTTSIADYFATALLRSGITQEELAKDVGFKTTSIISLFKTGRSKIPVERIAAIASALKIDEGEFLTKWLGEYHPELKALIDRHYQKSN